MVRSACTATCPEPGSAALFDPADRSVGLYSDVRLVGHQHDGHALAVQSVKNLEDLIAGAGVEVAGGLIGEQ